MEEMDFGEAMRAVVEGKRVRRLEWNDEGVYVFLLNDKLHIFNTEEKKAHPLLISSGDILGDDWVVANVMKIN